MLLFLSGVAKSPPGSDSELGTGQAHFFLYHIPIGNHLRQLLLGTKSRMGLSLEHGEEGSKQPSPKTRENGLVLCLLTKLHSISSLVIYNSTTNHALLKFPETPQTIIFHR